MKTSTRLLDAAIVLTVIAIVASIFIVPPFRCGQTAKLMGMPGNFVWGVGCMIEVKPGQWVPLSAYRAL